MYTVENVMRNTVYQVLSACIHFPLCSREYQNREKFNRENLTQSCKKLSLGFREKFTRVDLIHDLRLEFADKTWRVNNLIFYKDLYTDYKTLHCIAKCRVDITVSLWLLKSTPMDEGFEHHMMWTCTVCILFVVNKNQ